MDSKYDVTLLDEDGYTLAERSADNLIEATKTALYLLSDPYARMGETTHAALGSHKVVVRDRRGNAVRDYFLEDLH